MTELICNTIEKLNPPPFITTVVTCPQTRRVIFSTWSKLRKQSRLKDKNVIIWNEIELLKGYIERKGTQLRLEKALMLTNRIYKLGTRWISNRLLHEYTLFDDGVQFSLEEGTRKSVEEVGRKKTGKKNEGSEGIRLPSRQWSNWIIYLTLRDGLILAKIKYECERAVKYWLGLISSSHHATDSLVAVGILSRMWFVSSSMVEDFISVMYPTVCKLSIHLEPTKAENWLKDFETPVNLSSWLEFVLGFPFIPAKLSRGMEQLGKQTLKKAKMESVLSDVFKKESKTKMSKVLEKTGVDTPIPSTSSSFAPSDDEDLGIPVTRPEPKLLQKSKKKKKTQIQTTKNVQYDEKWKTFFTKYKTKLKDEKGKKQFLVRIRKYLAEETDNGICLRLKRFRKYIKTGNYDQMMKGSNQLKKYLEKIKS